MNDPIVDPLYAGELKARTELTLAAVLRALLTVIPFIVVAGVLGTSNFAQVVLLLAMLLYTLALYILQRRGYFALCVHAVVFGLLAFAAASTALSGSIRGIGTIAEVAAITVGGIFLPRRSLIAATLLSIASIGTIVYAENAGWLPAPNYKVKASHWAMFSFIVAAVALVLSYMRSLLIDVVRRLGNELENRRKTDVMLRELNASLERRVQERTEALTKSVEQLTALGEVGQALSSTLDLDVVLKTVVTRAVKLAEMDAGVIYEYDETSGQFQLRASKNFDEESVAGLRGAGIRKGEGAIGTSVELREPVQVPDTHAATYPARLRELLDRAGFRAVLSVPLLREEHIVGVLMVIRKAPGPFAAEVVDLLKTFATQSALAIQNARLFRELAEKGRQLEVASRHKSNFLASMSHELRTPLNAILGFNEMMLDGLYGELPTDLKDPLDETQKSGKHLLRLINNVLDLAKIEAGKMELALSDYSVQDTVDSVRSTLRPLAESKGIEFGTILPPDLPLAYGDSGRLTQCLINLAGNSLKFTKEGRVDIAVELDSGNQLRYRIADTGIGIPSDKIGSLFTEFKQTDANVASEYGGTGLGLSISKKFVEMHGGRIWVESELGKGSTFFFEIPLRVSR